MPKLDLLDFNRDQVLVIVGLPSHNCSAGTRSSATLPSHYQCYSEKKTVIFDMLSKSPNSTDNANGYLHVKHLKLSILHFFVTFE